MGELRAKQCLFYILIFKDKNRFRTASAELGAFYNYGFMCSYNYFNELMEIADFSLQVQIQAWGNLFNFALSFPF
jgi:hypothetical protein